MFIAHLPAWYILTKKLQKHIKNTKYFFIGLVGSIFPDSDILYFYLIDNKQNLHHSYWIHRPFYWLIITVIFFFTIWLLKREKYYLFGIVFFSNIFLHLFLDTIVWKVEWLFPISNKAYYFFDVPDVYDYRVYNFVFHWTFLFEVLIILWAISIIFREKT